MNRAKPKSNCPAWFSAISHALILFAAAGLATIIVGITARFFYGLFMTGWKWGGLFA